MLQNPEVSDKVPGLFAADWAPASQGGGLLSSGASAYFGGGGPLRMVRIGGLDYVIA